MLWESLAISARSALRQAARTLRSVSSTGDRRELLQILAGVVDEQGEPVDENLGAWPTFESLQEAWERLWREEDDLLGARRRIAGIPEISVFETPGESMGFSKPKNLPWDQPLLCWSQRERDGLRDLLGGNEQSLARSQQQFRTGRLSGEVAPSNAPSLVEGRRNDSWVLEVPRQLPEFDEGFSDAVDRAYAALYANYRTSFAALDNQMKARAISLLRGAYGGYLQSAKPIWKRRFAGIKTASTTETFRILSTGLADALEWPILVDVFEEGVDGPRIAKMPRFTLPAVWYDDAQYAPVWLPVETLGEALEQAPLRFRNVHIGPDSDDVRWRGDHTIDTTDLQTLSVDNLLRSMHEGAITMTIHTI